jgi:signal-transduction protein with cAMP-binding, CBS, and nucleotidyltransferase domain
MWDEDCGAIPVLDDKGDVVAMVTDRDICIAAYTQGRTLSEIPVMTAASHRVHWVRPDDCIETAEILMRRYRIRRLPVLDFGGNLVGLLAFADIVRRQRGSSDPNDELSPEIVASTFAILDRPQELWRDLQRDPVATDVRP